MFEPLLTDFESIRPKYEISQEETLAWIKAAHKKAAERQSGKMPFSEKLMEKVSCKPTNIGKRSFSFSDCLNSNWKDNTIYTFEEKEEGKGFGERSQLFLEVAEEIFSRFYPEGDASPEALIHVTCTGYNAPSAAQRLVTRRGWSGKTSVTHAYHMGCLAAVPAIRMGVGYLGAAHLSQGSFAGMIRRVDLVHTEISSLHFNPALHTAEQFVGQSLFADGFIKYSIVQKGVSGLKVKGVAEETIPNSTEAMGWECEEWGLRLTLSKEIPMLLSEAIVPFVKRLAERVGLSLAELQKRAIFTIHPGGPKIIEKVATMLALSDEQLAVTNEIFYECGNMSSATLPHMWEKIVERDQYPTKTLVVGLAFGPGLTMVGIVLEKV